MKKLKHIDEMIKDLDINFKAPRERESLVEFEMRVYKGRNVDEYISCLGKDEETFINR